RGQPAVPDADRQRQREIVNAFLEASRGGNFSALLAVLDPDVVVHADAAAVAAALARAGRGAPELAPEIRGREPVAKLFHRRAQAARLALVDGAAGLVVPVGGRLVAVFAFTTENGAIAEIALTADERTIAGMALDY